MGLPLHVHYNWHLKKLKTRYGALTFWQHAQRWFDCASFPMSCWVFFPRPYGMRLRHYFACQHSMVCGEKMALITGCNIRKHPAASFLTLKLRRDGRATLTLRGPTILTPIPSTEYECVQRWLLRKMTSMQMLSRVVSPSDRNEKAVGIAYQVQYALWCISKAIQLFNRDKALV